MKKISLLIALGILLMTPVLSHADIFKKIKIIAEEALDVGKKAVESVDTSNPARPPEEEPPRSADPLPGDKKEKTEKKATKTQKHDAEKK